MGIKIVQMFENLEHLMVCSVLLDACVLASKHRWMLSGRHPSPPWVILTTTRWQQIRPFVLRRILAMGRASKA